MEKRVEFFSLGKGQNILREKPEKNHVPVKFSPIKLLVMLERAIGFN